jgi:hypothetical protein
MKTHDDTQFRIRRRIPRAAGWLLWAQLGLAGIALVVALLPLCGRCGSGSWKHAAIAGAGVLGYAGLLALHRKRMSTPVTAGILAAAGVHAALGGMMMTSGSFCIVCTAAALAALANGVTVLVGVSGSVRWIPRVLVPSFSLAWIALYLALSADAADTEKRQETAHRALTVRSETTPHVTTGHPVLTIFEMEGCHYCLEFRNSYAPRLKGEFPGLEIVYRKAEDELWVRRTPTITLGDAVLFEGFPTQYRDLARAIEGVAPDAKTAKH